MAEGDKYPWLDEWRARLVEVIATKRDPTCPCTWTSRLSQWRGFEWVLDVRDINCRLHGQEGLF